MQIDKMNAGRKLDALIAKHVLKWAKIGYNQYPNWDDWGGWHPGERGHYQSRVPPFSTNITAAWHVIHHIKKSGFSVCFELQQDFDNTWEARFYGDWTAMWGSDAWHEAKADTAELAICRVALKVVCYAE